MGGCSGGRGVSTQTWWEAGGVPVVRPGRPRRGVEVMPRDTHLVSAEGIAAQGGYVDYLPRGFGGYTVRVRMRRFRRGYGNRICEWWYGENAEERVSITTMPKCRDA